jgi:glycosyltransferase involved in cell wall biosynthesis
VDVTVVVGTFGGPQWSELALSRAVPSAEALGVPVIHHHGDTLHQARNQGLYEVDTEWVCHLDADDELEPGYFTNMDQGTADVRAPSVRYVRDGNDLGIPYMPAVAGHEHGCTAGCLVDGNWLVVGSPARADLLRRVGGWRDWDLYEDWDLWQRCWLTGATFEPVPAAVYRAHRRRHSRNRAPDRWKKEQVHHDIRRANLPHLYDQATA